MKLTSLVLLLSASLLISASAAAANPARPVQPHDHASHESTAGEQGKEHAICDDKKGCPLCAEHKTKEECADACNHKKDLVGSPNHQKDGTCPHHDAKPKADV